MALGMKKIFVTPLDAVETTDKEGVGVLRFEGNSVYKWVKLLNSTATVAGAAGDPVGYAAATGHSTHTVVIDLTDADAAPVCAGFLMGTVTGTAGTAYYCWIKIKGPVTVVAAIGGTPADGNAVYLGTTDKTLTKATAVTQAICGIATDASAKLVAADCLY